MKVANVISALMAVSLSISGAVLDANFGGCIVVSMVVFVMSSLLLYS